MTKEERQKYKELTKVLPKILKDKIKKYNVVDLINYQNTDLLACL